MCLFAKIHAEFELREGPLRQDDRPAVRIATARHGLRKSTRRWTINFWKHAGHSPATAK
jgi:hypothetical protein